MIEARCERDALWDEEIRGQAVELGLAVLDIDGQRPLAEVATDVAAGFRMVPDDV